jgi:hypothetical protein
VQPLQPASYSYRLTWALFAPSDPCPSSHTTYYCFLLSTKLIWVHSGRSRISSYQSMILPYIHVSSIFHHFPIPLSAFNFPFSTTSFSLCFLLRPFRSFSSHIWTVDILPSSPAPPLLVLPCRTSWTRHSLDLFLLARPGLTPGSLSSNPVSLGFFLFSLVVLSTFGLSQ